MVFNVLIPRHSEGTEAYSAGCNNNVVRGRHVEARQQEPSPL